MPARLSVLAPNLPPALRPLQVFFMVPSCAAALTSSTISSLEVEIDLSTRENKMWDFLERAESMHRSRAARG